MGFRGPNLRNCGRKCKKRRRKCDTGRTALANLPEEGGDVAGKASVRGPGKEARAAQGGAGEARGGAGEGAERVGGVWVREGAGEHGEARGGGGGAGRGRGRGAGGGGGSAGRRGGCGAVQGKRPSPRRTSSRGRGQPHRPGETGKRGGRGHLSTLAGGTMTSADTGNVGGWEGGSFAAGAPAKCLPVGALWQGAF